MRNIIVFLIAGTVVSILLTIATTLACATCIVVLAKIISLKLLTILPFSIIGGIFLSFILYGKVIKKVMDFLSIDTTKLYRKK